MTQEPFRQFAEELITKGNTTNFPADFTAELRDMLAVEIEQLIGQMVLKNLDEKSAEEFAVLMGQEELPTPEVWKSFFEKNIPDFDNKVSAILAEVAKEFDYDNKFTA